MAKLPQPFVYRNKLRASVTLDNGQRRVKEFPLNARKDARAWIAEQVANVNSTHAPELGGPTQATLADAFELYAQLYTVNKGGAVSELTRISHYLEGAGKRPVKLAVGEGGQREVVSYTRKPGPRAWQEHTEERREARTKTYEHIAKLAGKRCCAITTADIRRLVTAMEAEGLSPSTIQKEVALLRHLFNMAITEWKWKGFENPCRGIKLGKSKSRFVFLSTAQRENLQRALEECDNPYYQPLVHMAMQTTLRLGSLLAMRWDKIDLEGRVAQVPSKTGPTVVPLTRLAVEILQGLPRHESGRVFPMTTNAVDCAWDGIRQKAGLPTMQFRDLRHVGATDFARRGFTSHQLKAVLGHKTLQMAEVYVNLVQQDVLDVMDRTEGLVPVVTAPPPVSGTAEETMRRKRSARLSGAIQEEYAKSMGEGDREELSGNVIHLKFRQRVA